MSGSADVRGQALRWGWGLLIVAGGVSMAMNVGHAFVQPASAGADWEPSRWLIAWGVIVPVLFFAIAKAITLPVWPSGRGSAKWMLWRWCGALPVFLITAYVSWMHISGLLSANGESWQVGLVASLAVDGVEFIGMGLLLAAEVGHASSSPRPTLPGVAASFNGHGPVPAGSRR